MDISTAPAIEALGEQPATLAARIVRAAMRGDVGAFETLIGSRIERTHRIAQAILGSTHDAGDATQEAWLAAWRQLPTLREPERGRQPDTSAARCNSTSRATPSRQWT